jgi:hypothetical protein
MMAFKTLKHSIVLLTFVFLAACSNFNSREIASTHHIGAAAEQLVKWETEANAVSTRSSDLIRVEHYEIPLRLLEADYEKNMDSQMRDSIIFTKNKEKYVRWLINPEDSKWHLEVKAFLEKNNIDSTPKKFFDGYLTASRSMILVNPDNGATFSLKVSTDKTGGKWTDKKQTWADAVQVRSMNNYVASTLPNMQTETLVILDEPLAMGIKDLDQAMIMRRLNDLPSDEHYYLPAFSALHNKAGEEIARLNGSKNPVQFWEKHLVEPIANAMAEYFAYTGAWYDSPHAQNFLIELDREMKPTGRIVMRDLGDAFLLEGFVANTKFAHIMKTWDQKNIVKDSIATGIGLLHGNERPGWMFALEYKEYGWAFYRHFEKKFSEITHIPLNELQKVDSKEVHMSYTRKNYPVTSDSWKKFFHYAACMNGEPKTLKGEPCPDFMIKRQRRIDCVKAATAIIR